MTPVTRQIALAAAVLAGFAALGGLLVAGTQQATYDRIAAAQRAAVLASFAALLPPDRYDNDPISDRLLLDEPQRFGGQGRVVVHRARLGGAPAGLIGLLDAPDGYSGPIRLMIAVLPDGRLAGVRVLAHKETPGLGDKIETGRSSWIHSFAGRSLSDPAASGWAVRKDGGVFDQFSGATVTPRAIVKAVHRFLSLVHDDGERLYQQPSSPEDQP